MKARLLPLLVVPIVLICGGCPQTAQYVEGSPRARFTTTLGEFVVELEPNLAPMTVANFTQYVEEGFYNGTIFHRVLADVLIQGGGLTPDLTARVTRDPIVNEGRNGLRNLRGTIAMARLDDPDSAAAQFFINLRYNNTFDANLGSPGYAVFGWVVEGLEVVDAIGAVTTGDRPDFGLTDVPVTDVVIQSVTLEQGPDVLSAEWQAYYAAYQAQAAEAVRAGLVDLLGTLISSASF